jgi:hypothetical protein
MMSKRVQGNGTFLPTKLPSSVPAIVRLAGLEYVLSFGIKCKTTLWDKKSQLFHDWDKQPGVLMRNRNATDTKLINAKTSDSMREH